MPLVLPVSARRTCRADLQCGQNKGIYMKNAQKYPRKNEKIGEYYEFAL